MARKTIRAPADHSAKNTPPAHWSGADTRPVDAPTSDSTFAVSTFQLSNSDVVVQRSPVGYICRIERSEGQPKIEYAGPHDRATLLRLAEVSA